MNATFDLRLLSPLVVLPDGTYLWRVEAARRAAATSHIEAARHLGLFAERLRDLGLDELQELYRESFTPGEQAALGRASGALGTGPPGTAATASLPIFEQLLPRLASARNPFTLLFKAFCCLLIAHCGSARTS